jgi:hypothetical protein
MERVMGELFKKFIRDFVIYFVFALIIIGIFYSLGFFEITTQPYKKVVQPENLKEDEIPTLSWVSSTEYTTKDADGSTIVKIRDNHNNFINTSCLETILFPNRTVYLQETQMNQDFVYGEYFLDFAIPDTYGVYSQEVKCLFKDKNVSSAKAFHISLLGDKILASNNNLNQTLQTILNTLDCNDPQYTVMCDYLRDINQSQTNNSLTIIANQSFVDITNIVTSINETLEDSTRIYYSIYASDCFVGGIWQIEANITNEAFEQLRFLNCTLTTNVFGSEPFEFNSGLNMYSKIHNCSPEGITSWDILCHR